MRLVEHPGSTSSKVTPSTARIAEAIAAIVSLFCPSEKFGTHSIILESHCFLADFSFIFIYFLEMMLNMINFAIELLLYFKNLS